jgi:hypothetical protein
MRARSAAGRSGYLRYNRRACDQVGPRSCHVFPCFPACALLRSIASNNSPPQCPRDSTRTTSLTAVAIDRLL